MKLVEIHQATAKVLEKDSDALQAFASRATSPAQKATVKRWQIKLDAFIDYYNAMDDLLNPQALNELQDLLEQAKSQAGMELEERVNYLAWKLDHQERETERFRKLYMIAREILKNRYEYDTSLLNWMKPEDVGLSLAS